MKKPLYTKLKLLKQTKINLWNKDENLLKKRLNKKSWSFLKTRGQRTLDNFSFNPFDPNPFRRRLNLQFKNNLYFRKLVRLKYARLRNKEFYNIFRKSNGYKALISNLGSRLDINIFNILASTTSIFFVRQRILHGSVLLNGQKVKHPNIMLKPLDIISLQLSDFAHDITFYQSNEEYIDYLENMAFEIFLLGRPHFFSKNESLEQLANLMVSLVPKGPSSPEKLKKYYIEVFEAYFHRTKDLVDSFIEERSRGNEQLCTPISLKDYVKLLNNVFMEERLRSSFSLAENKLLLSTIKISKNNMNFFNNGFNYNNFEFKLNGNFLDIVFLGYPEDSVSLEGSDKYSLHYLFR